MWHRLHVRVCARCCCGGPARRVCVQTAIHHELGMIDWCRKRISHPTNLNSHRASATGAFHCCCLHTHRSAQPEARTRRSASQPPLRLPPPRGRLQLLPCLLVLPLQCFSHAVRHGCPRHNLRHAQAAHCTSVDLHQAVVPDCKYAGAVDRAAAAMAAIPPVPDAGDDLALQLMMDGAGDGGAEGGADPTLIQAGRTRAARIKPRRCSTCR